MNETKYKLLKATSEIFIEDGIKGLSARSVAKRAGMSTIGIYSNFNGMQGLLDALYIEGFEKVTVAMDVSVEQLGIQGAIVKAINNYLEFAENYDAHYRLIYGIRDSNYNPSPEARKVGAQAFAKLTKLVSLMLPNDALLAEKQNLAMQFWAMSHGFVSLHNHPVTDMVPMQDWKQKAIDAVVLHMEAIRRDQQKVQ